MAIPSYLLRNPLVSWGIARRMRVVLNAVDLRGSPTLLDYGCGVGMLLLQLPPRACTYYGVDLMLGPAETVLGAHGRDDFELLEASDWTDRIPDGTLDYIVALEVLEHVDDVRGLADDFRRKLKPDGKLVVSGPTENALYQLGRRLVGFSGDYHHRNIYQIMSDVERAGFARTRRTRIPMAGPFALFVISVYQIVVAGTGPDAG